MCRVGEPGTGRPRERWLRVVRDDEVAPPPEPPAPLAPPAGHTAPAPPAARPEDPHQWAPPAPSHPSAPPTPPAPPAARRTAPVARRPPPPRSAAAGTGAPAREAATARAAGRRWGWVIGVPAGGTGLAVGADHLMGGLDGRPALHLLIVLALPFWDTLPDRLGPRLLALAGVVAAIAAVWLLLAALRPEPWWRAEVAFGLACALVGVLAVAVSALAGPGRTVDR